MAIRHTSDSLNRCDPGIYSNFYDARKKNEVRQEPMMATRPLNKDTLEISRDQLKKEALNRLRHTSKYLIFQTGFMRVGKYLFVGVAFPPYFLLYGMPKWILVRGLPAILLICTTVSEKVKQKVKKYVERIQHKVKETVLSIQQLAQRLIRPIARLLLEAGQAFGRMRQTAQTFFKRLIIQVKDRVKIADRVKIVIKRSTERLSRISQHLKERMQNGKRIAQEWSAPLLDHVKGSLHWLGQLPEWGGIQLQRLNSQLEEAGQKGKRKLSMSRAMACQGVEWLTKQTGRGKQGISRLFTPLQLIYRGALQPVWKLVCRFLRGQKLSAGEFFSQKKKQLLELLHQGQEKLKRNSYQQALEWLSSTSRFARWPAFLQVIVHRIMGHWVLQGMFKRGFSVFKMCLGIFLKGLSGLIHSISRSLQVVRQVNKAFLGSIHSFTTSGAGLIGYGLVMGNKGIKKIVYGSLVFMIMLSLIGAEGIQLLGDLMQKLSKRIWDKSSRIVAQDK